MTKDERAAQEKAESHGQLKELKDLREEVAQLKKENADLEGELAVALKKLQPEKPSLVARLQEEVAELQHRWDALSQSPVVAGPVAVKGSKKR